VLFLDQARNIRVSTIHRPTKPIMGFDAGESNSQLGSNWDLDGCLSEGVSQHLCLTTLNMRRTYHVSQGAGRPNSLRNGKH
jgi:hypothetical protein